MPKTSAIKQHTNRDGTRSYSTPAGRFWSVTTILGIIDKSAPLTYWAAKCAAEYIRKEVRRVLEQHGKTAIKPESLDPICDAAKKEFRSVKEEAADLGTQVHEYIDRWCKAAIAGHDVPAVPEYIDPRVLNGISLFLEWAAEVKLKPITSELFVSHPILEYAGTTDIVAEGMFSKRWKKPRTYVIDIKTSKGVYETMEMQVSSYTEAFKVTSKLPIEGEGIIRVGKEDGKFEFVDCSERHTLNFMRFKAAKDLVYLMKGRPQ
jgi:hypothetical protein